jgi:hypothetical protein
VTSRLASNAFSKVGDQGLALTDPARHLEHDDPLAPT